MEVILKIPKRKEKSKKTPSSKIKKITMEIIDRAEFGRTNIKFSSEPPEKVKEILIAANWFYNSRLKLWYPKGKEASENSYDFAKMIQKVYFN